MRKNNTLIMVLSLPLSYLLRRRMIGRLVRSKSGRDKGRYYLVLARAADILYLADGQKRTIANPKKKNYRHVQIVHKVAADLMNKKNGELPSDLETALLWQN